MTGRDTVRTQVTFDAADRVHLDIHVESSRKADEAARLTRLGAELIATHDDRGPLTYVMRDPEGNEFCLH